MREVAWQEYFTEAHITPFTIIYEDFIASPEPTIRQMLAHLNISVPSDWTLKEMITKKMADATSEMWVREYHKHKRLWPSP
jgi:LPS sulfotransferase NodH